MNLRVHLALVAVQAVIMVVTIVFAAKAGAAALANNSPSGGATVSPPAVPVGTASLPGGDRSTITVAVDVTPTTSATQVPRRVRPLPPDHSEASHSGPAGNQRTVSSTAYCLTGTMANGQRVHDGAVAMNGVGFGVRWRVLSGPMAGRVFTVKDRIGHSSQFDIAMPGRCDAARRYGRHTITIERVS